MAQTEVGEVSEGGSLGGSSAMPHKHNPVAAISARACARRAPGLVGTLFGAMEQEHERAAGAWHSEWPTLTALLTTVGSAAAWLAESLERAAARHRPDGRLRRRRARPRARRCAADALTPDLGRGAAHDAVAEAVREAAASGRPLATSWPSAPTSTSPPCSAGLPDTGEAGVQVDAVLADHARLTEGTP